MLGPQAFFKPAMEELKREYASHGINGDVDLDLEAITADDIETLVRESPPIIYFRGFDNEEAWERLKVNRDWFVSPRRITVFFLIPSQYRDFVSKYSSIASLAAGTHYSLGGQKTMDDMGDPFLNRLHMLLDKIDDYEEQLDDAVNEKKQQRPDHLIVLRRWNSFSPLLAHRPPKKNSSPEETVKETEASVWRQLRREIRGGGYFFSWKKFGIAVDPGHNYVENLYQNGYSVRDIDAVVITHDHLDHHADFEAIVDLLYQCNKRGEEKKISVFLNPTTYTKYYSLLKNDRSITRVAKLKLDGGKYNIISQTPSIRLHSLLARHTELGGNKKAASLKFRLSGDGNSRTLQLGFTADTGWHPGMKDFFSGVDVLVAHVGSVKRYEIDEARFYGNHLGVLGLFKILQEIYTPGHPPTVILSEFGEELMGLRDILGKELSERFPGMKVFPADIGHSVVLKPGEIKVLCGEHCMEKAQFFFEYNGEIALRCEKHRPALGHIDS